MSVEDLRASRDKAAVKFMEFTRLYRKNPDALFCCFEGKDAEYYGVRIDIIVKPEHYQYLNCSGKEAVLAVHRMVSERKQYNNVKLACFVDRDFDPSIATLGLQGIYETPCYSIENLYTTTTCFIKILKSRFQLIETDKDFENCLSLYKERQVEFHDCVEELNVWIACQRDKATEINLDKINFLRLITVNLDDIIARYSTDDLFNKFPTAVPISQEEFEAKKQKLRGGDRQKTFRGKYEIAFLIQFFKKLVEKANTGQQPYFSEKRKVALALSLKTVIGDLSQYADTPDCLGNYLRQFV
ncbi:MAG: DUF4435 domain-containing protein [Cyanobacteria bacterium P01_F01_bin.150]